MDLLQKIKSLIYSSGNKILDKNEIYYYHNELNNYIDFMIICQDYNICIKDFWTFNNINQNTIKTYIDGSVHFNRNSNKKTYFILLKKNIEKKYNQKYNLNDYKNKDSEYLYIIEKNSIEKLINHFSLLMYSNGIFFYESDGSAIMLDLV